MKYRGPHNWCLYEPASVPTVSGPDLRIPDRYRRQENFRNDDHELKAKVLAELDRKPSVTSDHIGVTAEDGVVTLSGPVTSAWEKTAAERAVGRVKGVRAIAEEMVVRLPSYTLPKR